ncbi:choice-of-anchor I family protein [Chryseobacterium balustinum]|uniref:Por secretion system C-terminal sorting domain n=1 Tax=Chryseobacterium balustinum TaxID=246 RepID=A0AAX2IU41_9FLAO|nr:choice-of-anchor I family protein [Chryseobacterium balustinum]AZB28312.1 T9SS C-terminal target domain-containing protein [Chryseobacterium balustinum]SKB89518.1 Por secretion system C-terminal sorting domain-containing protein [Chryseobacterium balustinum]SQA92774.1 Por secretion system C-terminal sorting domain [Chryseobacterium balustinum]
MKNKYLLRGLLPIAALFHGAVSGQSTLVHYWNFNNNASVSAIITPTSTLLNGSITAVSTGTGNTDTFIDFAGGTSQNFNVDNLNARNGDASGTHLRYNYPINGNVQFNLPTTGYNNVVVKFSTRRSGSGAGNQSWSYSLDGTTFVPYQTVTSQDANPQLITFDFSNVIGVSNNPNFKLKVEFSQGGGGAVGNNRFDNFTLDATSVGGTDTTPATVAYLPANNVNNASTTVNPTITFNENVRLIDNSVITSANAQSLVELRLGNSTGNAVPFTTTFANNVITVIPTGGLVPNLAYYLALKPNMVEDTSDNAVTTVTSSIFTTAGTSISLDKTLIKVNENAGTLAFKINVINPSNATVNLVAKPASFNTANSSDFTFTSQTISITPSTTSVTVNIPILDDTLEEQQAEYFVLGLENPVGTTITGDTTSTVYIIDNDKAAPVPSNQISLNYIGSFDPSGNNNSSTEIVVHDPATQKLFTISSLTDVFDIINFSNPLAPSVINTVNMAPYGGITSIAVKNGLVAVASPNGTNAQQNGSVVFFDINGNFMKQVTVGVLPDMITFTPDGTKVMTANEGEPNDAYTVDPEGSISIIDISGGINNLTQSNVTTLGFTGYNSQEAAFISSGGRKVKSTSTLAQDLEPEYIAISPDSQKAWVSCQENNGIIEVNLSNNTLGNIWGLGKKDMSLPGNGFDASDNNGEILIANWPVKAYYNPDAMASFKVGNTNYLVTANEGDEKDLGGFSERTTVGANGYTLDSTIFPNASVLKASHNLGRFRVTNVNGNTDGDADFEEIHALGARSFSIFNADTKQIVYDSGDQFERYIAANHPLIFNADNEANGAKTRSRAKGPEPEGVTLGTIGTKTFAFITLERTGGVMVYNVTDPNNVTFVDYKHSRSTSAFGGDNGPEGITYIPPANMNNGKGYVVVANEISGTLSMYEVIPSSTLSTGEVKTEKASFNIFPNPVNKGNTLYFNRAQGYELYDMSGKLLGKEKSALTIDTSNLNTGVYLIKTSEGEVKRFIVK